ncbi:MAG TPA: PIG-L deacetylase family protein [Limnochordia bacterium]|nr:PIG-L deacetylase family protein [Limnochordia bacterium]
MNSVRVLVFGAHPDDCELKVGGTAALWAEAGHVVRFVSVTNGDTGHQAMGGAPLAVRRRDEAAAAAAVLGVESLVLDNHNGELLPTIENRKQIIRIIREFEPDLILTHRPNDYHPDHRYTSQLVQDAAYIVTVPNMVALTPHLRENPVIGYLSDNFKRPYPFSHDVAVDIGPAVETKLDAVHCHTSQMYEWLPYNGDYAEGVPTGEAERRAWLGERLRKRFAQDADHCRERLAATYGERSAEIVYAESFEICEYGSALSPEKRARLFPFLPGGAA